MTLLYYVTDFIRFVELSIATSVNITIRVTNQLNTHNDRHINDKNSDT